MSAPQTNLDKQKRRHRGPLIGMILAILFGAALAVYWASSGSDDVVPASDAAAGAAPASPGAESQTPTNP